MLRAARALLAAAILCAVSIFASTAQAQAATHFVVRAQPLADALRALGAQSNTSILFDPLLVEGTHAPALDARLSLDEALARLLAGTKLTYRFLNDHTVVLSANDNGKPRSPATQAPEPDRSIQFPPNPASSSAEPSTDTPAMPASRSPDASTLSPSQWLEEIIVTATKREERLQDVPLSVSVITAADMLARGYTQYGDYLNAMPGVFFQDFGPGTSQIRIRGVSSTSEGGVPSTTATYFGETVTSVITNFGGKPNLRLVDIDRVEVLRGPQGTLFGASALAGVVRIIPAAPDMDSFIANFGTRGYTTAHSDDVSSHFEGTINLPVLEDRVALRLVAYRDDIAGFIDNISPAQASVDYSQSIGAPANTLVTPAVPGFRRNDINSEDTWGARGTLRWQATDRLRMDLTHATQNARVNSDIFTMPQAGRYAQQRSMDHYEQGSNEERLRLTSASVNYDWHDYSLLSVSSWSELERSLVRDLTLFALPAFAAPIPWSLRDASIGKLFTQEIRLQSQGVGPVEWIAGVFYLRQHYDYSQFVADFSCPQCLPVVLFGQPFALDTPLDRASEERQRSIFAQVSYRFLPRWTLGIGARYLEDEFTTYSTLSEGLLGSGPPDPEVRFSAHEFNPSAYLRFEPQEGLTVYAQAARGFRSGSSNPQLPPECADDVANVGAGPATSPDALWNYELGVKSQLAQRRVNVNAAIYRQDWQGVQLATNLACGSSVGVNGGDAVAHGVEIEIVAQPTAAWRFNLSASYNQSEFRRAQPGTGFVRGERLPDVPRKNGSVGLQYNFIPWKRGFAFVRVDYVHVGDVRLKFQDLDGGTLIARQPAFDTANVRVSFRHEQLTVDLFGRNVADERGVVSTLPPVFNSARVLTRPREVGVELRYGFR